MITEPGFPYLRETLLFLALAGLLIPLLQRLRVNQVLGFLAVGAVLGPHGLGSLGERLPWMAWLTFTSGPGVALLSELGVLFLMFLIGLELPARRAVGAAALGVRGRADADRRRPRSSSAASPGCSATAWRRRWCSGWCCRCRRRRWSCSCCRNAARCRARLGQAAFSVLMMQDLAVVPILMLIGVMAGPAQGERRGGARAGRWPSRCWRSAWSCWSAGARSARCSAASSRQRQPEVFVALILLTTLSIAGLTAAAGLSMTLGAFLAGLLLAETEFRHEVEITVEPFKGLLMGLFFMSVGMGIDLREIARDPLWLVAVGARAGGDQGR